MLDFKKFTSKLRLFSTLLIMEVISNIYLLCIFRILNLIVNAKITMANPLTIVVFDETEDKRRIDSMNHIEREKGATVM